MFIHERESERVLKQESARGNTKRECSEGDLARKRERWRRKGAEWLLTALRSRSAYGATLLLSLPGQYDAFLAYDVKLLARSVKFTSNALTKWNLKLSIFLFGSTTSEYFPIPIPFEKVNVFITSNMFLFHLHGLLSALITIPLCGLCGSRHYSWFLAINSFSRTHGALKLKKSWIKV